MKYKLYQKYKDSGVEWIGEIPEHWEVMKLFVVLTKKNKKNDDSVVRKMLSVSQTLGIVEKEYVSEYKIRTKDESLSYRVVEPIDLVVNNMWIQYRGLGVSFISGIVSPAYHVYKINSEKIDPRFLNFLVRSDLYVNEYRRYLKGIRPNSLQISSYDFTRLPLVLPSRKEQEQIFDFLQNELDNIDDIISKSQSQIKLLQEKKLALITHTVTKGLDPTVRMKDSGVEWIGEIPEHWEVRKLKHLLSLLKDGSHNPPPSVESGIKFIPGATNIKNSKVIFKNCTYISEEDYFEIHKSYQLQPNDVLLTIVATLGNIALVNEQDLPFSMQRSIAILRPNSNITSKFLFYYFHSDYFQNELRARSHSAVKPGIYLGSLGNIPIANSTDKNEEIQISQFLDKETKNLNDIISKSQSQIKMLQEKRQALITATVTGKIDVRNGIAA